MMILLCIEILLASHKGGEKRINKLNKIITVA